MILTEISLTNLRKFSAVTFKLSPDLNLFWGLNESGKSTVHEAICCALFGRGRGQAFESWSGGSCVVELNYTSDGKAFQIERRLTEGVSKLRDISGDAIVEISSSNEDIARILAEHMGISSREVFESTVFVKQMSINPDKGLNVAGEEIQRVLTGTAHISAGEVQKRLEDKKDAIKGRPRPTNPREYDKLSARLSELAENLADARHSRDQIRNLEEELTQLQTRTEQDSARLETLSNLLERHKRWAELTKRVSELDTQHFIVFNTTRKIQHTLQDLRHVQEQLKDYADLVDKDEEIADHLTKIDGRRTELESRLNELGVVAEEAKPLSGGRGLPYIAGMIIFLLAGIAAGLRLGPKGFLLIAPAVILAIIYAYKRGSGGVKESRQIADLIRSAQDELNQLDVEEESILTYINCRTLEQAWIRIKSYHSFFARCQEYELTLDAQLNGRTLQDWEEEESEKARELSGLKSELERDFAGYSPTTAESESWRTEFSTLQNQLPNSNSRMHQVQGALEAERRNAKDLASLEGEIEFLHHRKQELEFLYKAYDEAISVLSSVTQTISEEYLPLLSEKAGSYMGRITSGRYPSINIKQGWEISLDSRDKSEITPTNLSMGTLDQLYLSLRIACGELLSNGRRLPIILDDPFATFDRDRLDNALTLIAALSQESQLLLLTHDPYILDWAQNAPSLTKIPHQIHQLT